MEGEVCRIGNFITAALVHLYAVLIYVIQEHLAEKPNTLRFELGLMRTSKATEFKNVLCTSRQRQSEFELPVVSKLVFFLGTALSGQ